MITLEHFGDINSGYYAKPSPIFIDDWASDVIFLAQLGFNTGIFSATVNDPVQQYLVFETSTGTPVFSDKRVGTINIPSTDLVTVGGSETIDGVGIVSLLEAVLSFIGGTTQVTALASGQRIIMNKQDGSTEKIRIDFNTEGEWVATTIT